MKASLLFFAALLVLNIISTKEFAKTLINRICDHRQQRIDKKQRIKSFISHSPSVNHNVV